MDPAFYVEKDFLNIMKQNGICLELISVKEYEEMNTMYCKTAFCRI